MISTIHDSTMVGSERGKRKYPARRCHICAAHKKEVKLGTSASSA
jgi:hypothetical protein